MVRRYKKKNRALRKSEAKKRPSKKNRIVTIRPTRGFPMPPILRVTLPYCEQFALDAAASTPSAVQFLANGIFDPNVAVGGHQPLGRDQFADFYAYYRVVSSTCRCEFIPASNTSAVQQYVGIEISENSGFTPTGMSQIVERGNGNYKPLGLDNGGHDYADVRTSWNAKTWIGPTSKNDQYQAAVGADPTNLIYYNVYAAALLEATQNPGSVYCMVTIKYDVEFYGMIQTNQS